MVAARSGKRQRRRRIHVLVVDDSKLQCAVWRKLLEERYGDKVSVQYRGFEFVGRVDQFSVRLNPDGTEIVKSKVSILEAIRAEANR